MSSKNKGKRLIILLIVLALMAVLYFVVYPKLKVGDNAVVGAGSVVMRAVKPDTTVMGNPAKKME